MCIKIAWDRVRNMFATVFMTITTIWRQGFSYLLTAGIADSKMWSSNLHKFGKFHPIFTK